MALEREREHVQRWVGAEDHGGPDLERRWLTPSLVSAGGKCRGLALWVSWWGVRAFMSEGSCFLNEA